MLVLHGGATRGDGVRVSPTQLSVLRMIVTSRTVAAASKRLAVFRLINTFRGWNAAHTPVQDADWALDHVAQRYPDTPVGLVGHSLGGRAALESGDHRSVRCVVALNPWLYPTDDVDLAGRRVLFVHGGQDRIAPIDRAEAVARRLARRTDVGFVTIGAGKHAMLRHGRDYDQYAAQFCAAVLLGEVAPAGGPVSRVLGGEQWVRVT